MDKSKEIDISDFLSIEFTKKFNALSKTEKVDTFLRVERPAIQKGIITALGGLQNFGVLLAVASFMDENGNCYPTQRQIAAITGLSLPTVNKSINELLEIDFNDKKIINRKLIGSGNKKSSYYTILNIGTSVCDEEESTNNDHLNAKDIISLFCRLYHDEFDVAYNMNWGRDGKLIKEKLLPNFTAAQIRTMIETGIRNYKEKWAKPKYERPTISMMCGWLGNQALTLADSLSKEADQFNEIIDITKDADSEMEAILSKL